jgi:hypothetical protein
MTSEIQLSRQLPAKHVAALRGKLLDWRHYRTVLSREDADVYMPNGEPLLMLRHRALPMAECEAARDSLLRVATLNDNRPSGPRKKRMRKDGTQSKQLVTPKVYSGIAGYFEANPRRPFCGATSFTARRVNQWQRIVPFVQAVDDVFRDVCPPLRYASQNIAAMSTEPELVIAGTTFTTLTVNRNYTTVVHKDQGDLEAGFGVIACLREGDYTGGLLVFPAFELAVDLRDRDVLLCEVHQWHGNTRIIGTEGEYDRLTTVLYYRTKMIDCR